MATTVDTINYISDQVATAGRMTARKMFGEYALYCNERVVGLVCGDTLFVKITDEGKRFVADKYTEGFAYSGAKASMLIDGDLLEDREWVSELIRITAENVPLPKLKNKNKIYKV